MKKVICKKCSSRYEDYNILCRVKKSENLYCFHYDGAFCFHISAENIDVATKKFLKHWDIEIEYTKEAARKI